jgi:Arc/MetJ family transcription regulator
MADALKITGLPTKKAVVDEALRILIRNRGFAELRSLPGKLESWDDYDYKAMREAD